MGVEISIGAIGKDRDSWDRNIVINNNISMLRNMQQIIVMQLFIKIRIEYSFPSGGMVTRKVIVISPIGKEAVLFA